MRPLKLRIVPLTLIACGLLLAPAANVIAGDSIATYRPPQRFTPGWAPANGPQVISYLGGEIQTAPPAADDRPSIDALAAAQVLDRRTGGRAVEQTAEISLRVVWFSKDSHFLTPTGTYRVHADEKRLMYVVLQHDHVPGGAGVGGFRAGAVAVSPPEPRCGVITFVDARSGELVYDGGQVICGPPV